MAHLKNQTSNCILLEKIDSRETNPALLGGPLPCVTKLPFSFKDIPYFDTTYLCNPIFNNGGGADDEADDDEAWDAPLIRRSTISTKITVATQMPYNRYSQTDISGINNSIGITENYSRDPSVTFDPIPTFLP